MVRSMYAGVAGMKANQTRMDVIGNNIANANTYGFKSSRATFRDMYYQQIRGASGGSATRGGTILRWLVTVPRSPALTC